MAKDQIFKSGYLKILFISILLAVFATFLVHLYVDKYISAVTGGKKVAVITPITDIRRGATITDGMLKIHQVPMNYVPENAIKPGYKDYILGQKAAFNVKHGGYLLWTDIFIEKKVILSQTLLPGERAITIHIDDVSGINGLIEPGDSVDILASFDVPGKDYSSTKSLTKVLLQDVIVLAVGDRTVSHTYMDDSASSKGFIQKVGREAAFSGASTVTLKLKPEEALMLTFAEEKGRIRLILRSRKDVGIKKIKEATFKKLLEFSVKPSLVKGLRKDLLKKGYGYPVIYVEGKKEE